MPWLTTILGLWSQNPRIANLLLPNKLKLKNDYTMDKYKCRVVSKV